MRSSGAASTKERVRDQLIWTTKYPTLKKKIVKRQESNEERERGVIERKGKVTLKKKEVRESRIFRGSPRLKPQRP